MMQLDQDTIVAISTAPGRGGIGIVRLSGPQALAIAEPLVRLRHPPGAGHARFGHLIDEKGEALDEVVVTLFAAPHSYTSEDVVEIAAHGSPVLLDYLLRACISSGARLANPGEFTQRAFLSGRLDLTQAEAVDDLIAAQTLQQARLAAAQLGGSLARAVAPIKQTIIALIAALEAGVDFAEDDLDLLPSAGIFEWIDPVCRQLEALAATYSYGKVLREGFTLAIVGPPNAGKSSLFNKLLDRERAIVTAQPGTTRDLISERLSLNGIPVELVDTAGLRVAESEAESQGMERTRTIMAEADVVLYVLDSTTVVDSVDTEDAHRVDALAGRPHLVVMNKCDLARPPVAGVLVSALTGEGMQTLKDKILGMITRSAASADAATVTNLRQHVAITDALRGADAARLAAAQSLPHELILLDLYSALGALDTLTGATTPDDILNLIFSSFCIGK